MAEHDDGGWDDDDIPWADPQIRADYEAALGRLILVHNQLDIHLTQLIGRALTRLDEPPAMQRLRQGSFAQRLDNLALLQAMPIELQLGRIDITELRALNRQRNIVAHGHFEQHPFDGDYVLIGNKQRHDDFSTARLNEITDRLQTEARRISALVDFYDPVILPPTGYALFHDRASNTSI